jgi:SsrA-binding protein
MKILTTNKKAFFEYEIIEKFSAGLSLKGYEVKSIVGGAISLKESFIKNFNNELFLFNAFVNKYKHSSLENIDEYRNRKLLITKKEYNKINLFLNNKSYTMIPLKIFLNDKHLIKLDFAVVKGKKLYDKRLTIKTKDLKREEEIAKKYF